MKVFTEHSELQSLTDEWRTLAGHNPFRSPEWFLAWYKHFDVQHPFVVVNKEPSQKASLIAPFYWTQTKLGANKLCLAGDGNVCTDYNQIVSHANNVEYQVAKLVCWIRDTQPYLDMDFLELEGLKLNDSVTQTWIDRFKSFDCHPEFIPLENSWVVDLPNNWDSLNATFSKKHRRKTKKAIKNLESAEVVYSNNENFDELWQEFVRLHQLRRQSLGEQGCFAESAFGNFLLDASSQLAKRELSQLIVIKHESQPIAATLVFNNSTCSYMYQTGFDPQHSRMEPGYMLVVAAMQNAISKGHTQFDFLRGDEPYKARWNAAPTPLTKVRFRLNQCARTKVEDGLRSSKRLIKLSLKQLCSLSGIIRTSKSN